MTDETGPAAAARQAVNTERVKAYLQLVAADHIDDDDERDYSAERDDVWAEMTQAERDTANDLVVGVFGDWIF